MRLNAPIARVSRLGKNVSQCKEEREVLSSSLGRTIEDNLWYLATLEWKGCMVSFFVWVWFGLVWLAGWFLCLGFHCFYLDTSPVGRFAGALELENCLRRRFTFLYKLV